VLTADINEVHKFVGRDVKPTGDATAWRSDFADGSRLGSCGLRTASYAARKSGAANPDKRTVKLGCWVKQATEFQMLISFGRCFLIPNA
jgi:hypothetical protein